MIKKIIVGLVILIPVAIIAAVVFAYMSINKVVKAGIEEFGPRFTGTSVSVEAVRISPFSGGGTIRGIVIGNPEGYKTPHAFRLGEVTVSLDPGSLVSEEILIHEIAIVEPEIIYEQGLTGSNISDLKKMVEERTGSEETVEEKAGPKVIIERFSMTDGKVRLGTKLSAKTLPVDLPSIELKDIGKGDATSTADAVNEIFGAVTGSIINVVAASGELLEAGKNAVKGIGEAGKSAVEGVKKLFK